MEYEKYIQLPKKAAEARKRLLWAAWYAGILERAKNLPKSNPCKGETGEAWFRGYCGQPLTGVTL